MALRISAVLALLAVVSNPQAHVAQSPGEKARQALENGDYPRAEQLFRSLLKGNENSAELFHNLGIALHFQGKAPQAVVAFQRALALKEMPGTLALLCLNYCRLRQYQKAAWVLKRTKVYFSDSKVLATVAPCYLEMGDPLEAVSIYRELVRRGVNPPDEDAVGLTRACFRAARDFSERLKRVGGNPVYWEALKATRGDAAVSAGTAIPDALKQAPFLRPNMPLEELAKALPAHPQDPPLLYLLSVASGEQAVQVFSNAQKQYPRSLAVRRLKAEVFATQGQNDQAIEEYQSILRDSPAMPGLECDLAKLYSKIPDWEKALLHFKQAAVITPFDEEVLIGISLSLARLGRIEEAQPYLKPLLETNRRPPEWLLLDLAVGERAAKRIGNAIRYLELVTKYYPESPIAHYRLSQLYPLVKRPDLAEQEAKTFLRLKQAGTAARPKAYDQETVGNSQRH